MGTKPDESSEWIPDSPAYKAMAAFGFDTALQALRDGRKVSREGWNGRGMFLELQKPDEHSKMTLPYIYISTVSRDLVPWLASQTDLLAEDWVLMD